MSTRYNNGSHYENHQRARELQNGAEHAHRAAEVHGQQEHLTPHEQTRQASEHRLHSFATDSGPVEFGHDDIASLARELWKARGCPEGSPDQDWFEAVKELRSLALAH
jgi:Protein of unknown function (DUF2934)